MFLQCCVDFYHTVQVSHNHTSTLSLPSRSSECQLLTSYPSCLYAVATFSIHPTLSLPPPASTLCNSCVFIPSLQIGSPIALFKVPYRHITYLFFSFCLTSLYVTGSRFIHLTTTDSNSFFFYDWLIVLCIYVSQLLYPFTCRQTSRSLPCPGCCKQCWDEHWDTVLWFSQGICPGVGLLGHMVDLFLVLSPYWSP